MEDEKLLQFERTEEELVQKRKAYLRRRVNRITNLFLDERRKQAMELLVDRLESLTTRELKFLIIGGQLPELPNDRGKNMSVQLAAEFTQLDPKSIQGVASIIVDEREKEFERTINAKNSRRSLWFSILALIVSLLSVAANIYFKSTSTENVGHPASQSSAQIEEKS